MAADVAARESEQAMKSLLLTTIAALTLIAGDLSVSAQNADDAKKEQPSASQASERRSTTGVGTSRVKITEEDRHVIREIVLKEGRVKPVDSQLTVEVGSNIPDTVELHEFPKIVVEKVPQVKTYSFFVWKDEVVLVDPKAKRVVEVIE